MSDVNLDRVRELAGHLRNAVRQLREIAAQPAAAFAADVRTASAAKCLVIVACEAALDICNHLAARRGARIPEDYADCMAILGELGAPPPDLVGRLARMARFRNLLVHLYARGRHRGPSRAARGPGRLRPVPGRHRAVPGRRPGRARRRLGSRRTAVHGWGRLRSPAPAEPTPS